ncbi:hypothetical protein DYBT9623_00736 [Dyadobacter sp. CECT 9623]|uniref:DUF4238 domain-containing protein n=1 Tax=Dyadobacter linearis TaxID=2823330 RepID=A0ABM8UKR9_9BACT|nr:DUF4238 domain-containing protein [Dyadobacter sp. CECT 9623]CAG5068008.1 hypothetical protein DYBT9623_00736 [Dyadobacter sp. CECT 9623]
MSAAEFRKNNHYLSQGYLKRWESSPNKVFVYRRLVSRENIPVWKEESIKKFAYQEHLYTRKSNGIESDEIERRFANEFEFPAESCIQNVVNEDRLTPDDWHKLVRFLALHDLRTPSRLIEHLKTFPETVPAIIEGVLAQIPRLLENQNQNVSDTSSNKLKATLPLKITTEIKDGEEFGILKVETTPGRQSWLSLMEHQLDDTAQILHQHTWTIMHPAKGMSWITSDKPVIRLNLHERGKYNFKGGWGNNGSKILMPLSPEHMLYACVGNKPPQRGTRFSVEQTKLLRRMIAEHAHRYVFGKNADDEVPSFVPRHVNAQRFEQEKEQWDRWHSEQNESEDFFLT